jgi:anthranilate phosphoribosyltransferase
MPKTHKNPTMDIKQAIATLIDGDDLDNDEMVDVMRAIMTGQATAAQIAGFLVALRLKGETVTEIAAAATVMRELATRVDLGALDHTVDIVGTGGDASGTFNVSTTSIFAAAAAGCHVAKHGNRSVSSKSGSADVLEAAGLRLDLDAAQVAQCVQRVGVGFMFAPAHHGAMKHAIGPRRELGVRTIFNILGPLTNPAGVTCQVLGVFSESLLQPLAEVLRRLGSSHVLVVHSRDGLDEISISDRTEIAELKGGSITRFDVGPEDFGLERAPIDSLRVQDPAESLALLKSVLANQQSPARDIVMLNAGAAVYVAGIADSLAAGVRLADEAIASGAAQARFDKLIEVTQSL